MTNRGAKRRMKMINKPMLKMDLQHFAEGEPDLPQFGMDDFKTFLESNEEAQKLIQSQGQSQADKQLEAWKANNLEKIKQDTIKSYEEFKKNKTPEQIELEKLKQEFESEKALRVTSDNKAFVAEQIAGLELDSELKDSVSQFMLNTLVSSDTEFTQKAVEAFTGVLGTINEKHADEIKSFEMNKAFGNKEPQQKQKTEPITNGREQLAKGLSELLGE